MTFFSLTKAALSVGLISFVIGCASSAPEEEVAPAKVITLGEALASARARGDAVTLEAEVLSLPDLPRVPPRQPMPAPDDSGVRRPAGLSRSAVDRGVKDHLAEVKHCYDLALGKSPLTAGKVVLDFFINGEGSVYAAAIDESTVGEPLLAECVRWRAGTWKFPKPVGGGTVRVTYPYTFQTNQPH